MLRSVWAKSIISVPARREYLRRAAPSLRRCMASNETKVENPDPSMRANDDPSAESAEQPSQQAEVQKLAKIVQDKEAEIAHLHDKTLRVLAEMENVRMIARRDVENARTYAITPFAKGLLSVADNLGLALNAVPESVLEEDESDPKLKGLFMGVGATESELLKVFSQHGINRFGNVGDKFDPNKYQAMFEAPAADHAPGTVIDVTKLGYTIGDRILRPAEVGVARSP